MVPKEFNGLPTHALAVHAAVVFVPLAALLAVLFVIPRTRRWAAIPMAIVSVVALLSLYVARASGFNFKAYFATGQSAAQFNSSPLGKAINLHEGRANVLFYLMIVFTMVTLVVYYLARDPERFTGVLHLVSCAVLIVGAVLVVVQVIRVGDAGARAVWNPTGTANYGMAVVSSGLPSS